MALPSGDNVRWVALSRIVALLSQLCGLLVFGRLLNAADFGVVAIAFAIVNFAGLLRDFGTSSAIIQKASISDQAKHAVFALNVGVGALLALLLFAMAGFVASFYGVPQLRSVIWLLAIGFPLTTVSLLHQALLERDSQFKTLARIELTSTALGLSAGVLSAAYGWGAYSLVAQALTATGSTSLQLLLASRWEMRSQGFLRLKRDDFLHVLPFGLKVTSANILNYAARNFDVLIVANLLGATAAGHYSIAARLMLFPLQSVTFVMGRALFPVMSRHQNDHQQVRLIFVRVTSNIAVLTALMMGLLWALRNELVELMLGAKWHQVADLLFWLAPAGFIQSLASMAGIPLMSIAATRALVSLSFITMTLYLGAFAIGGSIGLAFASQLYLLATVINAGAVLYMLKSVIGVDIFSTVTAAGRPAAVACAMVVFVVSLQSTLSLSTGTLSLLYLVALGFCFYLMVSVLLLKQDLISVLRAFSASGEKT